MAAQKTSYFRYDGERGRHVSFPLGGIGAGCVGLSGAGRLIDWEIANRPDKGTVNGFTHFAIRAESGGRVLDARILNGPFQGNLSGDRGAGTYREFGFGVRREYLTGMPHFSECQFEGFFPAANLAFRDPAFPGQVRMLAFSPFIPMDATSSSLPAAMFEFEVVNPTKKPINYSLFGSLGNPVKGAHSARVARADDMTGMVNYVAGLQPSAREIGEVMIATDESDVSWQHEWYRGSWFDTLEVYWKDLTTPGKLKDRVYKDAHVDRRIDGGGRHRGHATLAAHRAVKPGERATFRFVIAWYFPTAEKYWLYLSGYSGETKELGRTWKNYYATLFPGVEAVSRHVIAQWDKLRDGTLTFRDTLRQSTLPDSVLDAVSANISILKTPTVLRLEDGTLYGFEGCDAQGGSCEGSCAHVWNYQQAMPFLFPDLERSMREVDFQYNQDPDTGGMSFRLCLPLGMGRFDMRPCADGQFGNVMKAYRDWKISGDDAWLKRQWPAIRKAIEFAWHPANLDRWDPERTGVLWGRQHHTLDMELFGPNAWLTGFYLGALLAAARMAAHLGETDAAAQYQALFEKGKSWIDKNLFNGKYFVHKIDLSNFKLIDKYEGGPGNPVLSGSMQDLYWSDEHREIKYQVAEGCLLDQLLGQWHADLYGLGEIFDSAKVKTALRSMYALNFKERLSDVVNPCRVFGWGDESGAVVCEWPQDAKRPIIPVPYSQETFHGVEYAYGSLLMSRGEVEKGARIFRAVRDRYRGENRNPWNEMECGSNYARSMASYAGLLSLSGFAFDMSTGRIAFAPRLHAAGKFRSLWAVARAWGNVAFANGSIALDVLGGDIALSRLGAKLTAAQAKSLSATLDGKPVSARYDAKAGDVVFDSLTLKTGARLRLRIPKFSLSHLPTLKDVDRP